jgi:hypothetical protein
MGRKQQPVTQATGAFGWNTKAYANFSTFQKVIFWLWPLAILTYVFIVYWFVVFLANRHKPLQERREAYIKGLYYYNIAWLCLVTVVIVVLLTIALSAPDPSDVCTTFYCESNVPYGSDNRCENPAYILGTDDFCHPPCGAMDEYCTGENSYCYRNECVSCPSGTELYNDGSCYEIA